MAHSTTRQRSIVKRMAQAESLWTPTRADLRRSGRRLLSGVLFRELRQQECRAILKVSVRSGCRDGGLRRQRKRARLKTLRARSAGFDPRFRAAVMKSGFPNRSRRPFRAAAGLLAFPDWARPRDPRQSRRMRRATRATTERGPRRAGGAGTLRERMSGRRDIGGRTKNAGW